MNLPEREPNGLTVLDLCCCSGGASMGYWLAGYDVLGVDIAPRPNYPFPFVQADAIEYVREHGHRYDLIHASWPCQYGAAITKGTNAHLRDTYPDLLPPGREAMLAAGRPYVIENPKPARISCCAVRSSACRSCGIAGSRPTAGSRCSLSISGTRGGSAATATV
ncbi:hypothetical protein Srufu_079310 (plasmid) [Streptomyces libani subsp. rufus]|nr:hypothetical protein Srufu_079310 [Streptomyces libani subsp. rufus]